MAARAKTARTRVLPKNDWRMSGLVLLAIGLALAGLNRVIADIPWWFVSMLVATLVLLAAGLTRTFVRGRGWGSLAGALAGLATVTLFFAPATALLGIIPTFDTFVAFRQLEVDGTASIARQDIPADADAGIVYLLCLGVAAIAVAMDGVAQSLRMPALAGIPLLVLLLVPSLVDPSFDDPLFFVLTAAVYLGLLLVKSRPAGATALGLGALALAVAVALPAVLPAIRPGAGVDAGGGVSTGLNPIITLGKDLRRGDATLALTYTTTEPGGVYLRISVLDKFTGVSWAPSSVEAFDGNDVDAFGPPPGLVDAVARSSATTDITVADVSSRWLPVPYATTSLTGLVGSWSWEPDGLSVRTERSSARGQVYSAESLTVAPTVEQLVASGTIAPACLDKYLDIPADLPAVVGETALAVVGDAATNYDRAIALQQYFRGGEFVYSEDAPVEQDYDGSGAEVLAEFLDSKSGYCVHFSSAMAAMARTLGIPARVVVGFTPGQSTTTTNDATEYRVSTHDLHAWPELYFDQVGWVQFEPTPGRGTPPEFAPAAVDDPATPDVDESVPTPTVPTAAPTTAPVVPTDAPTSSGSAATTDAQPPVPWWWGVIAALVGLLLAPMVIRIVKRRRRLMLVESGSAVAAWDEVRDTADDLGLATDDGRTPRQLARDLDARLDDRGRAALERLRRALESEVFADLDGRPRVDDVTAVIRSLRWRAGVPTVLLSLIAPRSLFARWLTSPQIVN